MGCEGTSVSFSSSSSPLVLHGHVDRRISALWWCSKVVDEVLTRCCWIKVGHVEDQQLAKQVQFQSLSWSRNEAGASRSVLP